jgi:ACT domain-containing protein
MKAVITVVGHDAKGIIAKVSAKCADAGANIIDISQSVLNEYFAMIMIIEIAELNRPFTEFSNDLKALGKAENLDIRAMHESIFDAMHKI